MKICYVKLIRMKLGILCEEADGEELRLFSSREKAEEWLLLNDFRYGQRNFFDYPENGKEWYYKDDSYMGYIDVEISEIYIDDLSEPKLTNLET